jgi:DNA polymerase-1
MQKWRRGHVEIVSPDLTPAQRAQFEHIADGCAWPHYSTPPVNIRLLCGEQALQQHIGRAGIDKWRGSLLKCHDGMKAIPTFDMDRVNGEYKQMWVLKRDLKMALAESFDSKLELPTRTLHINPTFQQAVDFVKYCTAEALQTGTDIETCGGRTTCLGLASTPFEAMCIPFQGEQGDTWDWVQEAQLKGLLRDFFAQQPTVFHNGHYDMSYLKRDGLSVGNLNFDTQVAMHVLNPESPKSLAFLASMFTKEPYWKDDGKDWKHVQDWNRYYRYNCTDAAVTRELAPVLEEELERAGLEEVFDFEMSLVPLFVDITLKGINYNSTHAGTLMKALNKALKEMSQEVQKKLPPEWLCTKCKGVGQIGKRPVKECPQCGGTGHFVSLSSPVQVKGLLKQLGFKLPFDRKTHNESTSYLSLLKLQQKYGEHPLVTQLLKYSKQEQRKEMLEGLKPFHGRVHTTLACSTSTGRLASSASPFHHGANLQNIPHDAAFRKLFLPDPGFTLAYCDYSKAEAVIVAHESNDEGLLEVFASGRDTHCINAQAVFGCPGDPKKCGVVKADCQKRQLGKRIAHGSNYCMKGQTLADYVLKEGDGITITRKEADAFTEAYFKGFPAIREWQRRIFEELELTHTLTNCFGRRRIFMNRLEWMNDTHRVGVAYKPQSTVADLCNRALVEVAKLESKGVQLLLQVHDALLVQYTCDVETLKREMRQAMAIPMTINGRTFTVPVDVQTGPSWGEVE